MTICPSNPRIVALCVLESCVDLNAVGGAISFGISWVAFPGGVAPAVIASMPSIANNFLPCSWQYLEMTTSGVAPSKVGCYGSLS